MPNSASLAASPAPPKRSSMSSLTVINGQVEPAGRYQVREVLWGIHKRFVVRDSATNTTVAIRTTRQIADSDLLRLNWAAGRLREPGAPHRPALNDSPSAVIQEGPFDRQCGRCRQFFASDPTLNGSAIQDWWLCEACHGNLMGISRSATEAGSTADRAPSSAFSLPVPPAGPGGRSKVG